MNESVSSLQTGNQLPGSARLNQQSSRNKG
jgi:hypothetical protein